MPVDIKPGSWRTRCKRCGFTSIGVTRGDVVIAPPANKCPRCGSHEMERLTDSDLLSTLKGWLYRQR